MPQRSDAPQLSYRPYRAGLLLALIHVLAFAFALGDSGAQAKPIQLESLSVPASLPAVSLIRSLANGSLSLASVPQSPANAHDPESLDWPPEGTVDQTQPWLERSANAIGYTPVAYLKSPYELVGSYFGISVALKDPLLVVGAPMTPISGYAQTGYATIFSRSGFMFSTFSILHAKDARLPQLTNTFYGICVAISATHTFVAGIDDRSKTGFVAVYNTQGASTRYIHTIASPVSQPYSGFGRAISADERYLFIAAPFQDSNAVSRRGSIHVYIRLGISFVRTGEITNNMIGAFSNFGMVMYSESIDKDEFPEMDSTWTESKRSYIMIQSLPGIVFLYRESAKGSQPGQVWEGMGGMPGRIPTYVRNEMFDIHGSYFDNFQTGGVIIKVNNKYLQ